MKDTSPPPNILLSSSMALPASRCQPGVSSCHKLLLASLRWTPQHQPPSMMRLQCRSRLSGARGPTEVAAIQGEQSRLCQQREPLEVAVTNHNKEKSQYDVNHKKMTSLSQSKGGCCHSAFTGREGVQNVSSYTSRGNPEHEFSVSTNFSSCQYSRSKPQQAEFSKQPLN